MFRSRPGPTKNFNQERPPTPIPVPAMKSVIKTRAYCSWRVRPNKWGKIQSDYHPNNTTMTNIAFDAAADSALRTTRVHPSAFPRKGDVRTVEGDKRGGGGGGGPSVIFWCSGEGRPWRIR